MPLEMSLCSWEPSPHPQGPLLKGGAPRSLSPHVPFPLWTHTPFPNPTPFPSPCPYWLPLAVLWTVGGPAHQMGGSSLTRECQGKVAVVVHSPQLTVLLTDKDGGQLPPDEVLDEAVPTYRAPGRKSLLEIQQLDPDDESLAKYKRVLLGPLPPAVGTYRPWEWRGGAAWGYLLSTSRFSSDPSLPNVQVTRLTLMSEQAPGPMTMDLTGKPFRTPQTGFCGLSPLRPLYPNPSP